MPSRIAAISLDAADHRALATFWCAVLGWQVLLSDDTGTRIGPTTSDAADGAASDGNGPTIDLLPTPDLKTTKNRLHLDLRAEGTTTEAELDRLLALGAVRVDVGQPAEVSWVVLADPEGNEFCLLQRTVAEARERA